MAVEGDIAKVVNLYISNGWGVPVARGARFRGKLINMDLRNRPDVGHIFIDKSTALHQHVLGYVMQAVTRKSEPAPAAQRAPAASASPPDATRVTAVPNAAADQRSEKPAQEAR